MENIMILLVLLSFVGLLIGLFKPTLVIRWGTSRTRKQVLVYYGAAVVVCFVLFGTITEPAENDSSRTIEAATSSMEVEDTNQVTNSDPVHEEDAATSATEEKNEENNVIESIKSEEEPTNKQSSVSQNELANPPPTGNLIVYYFDVGQGDATLLKGPNFTILIDAGRHNANDVVPYLKNAGVKELDLVVGTHPHADHIGQIDKVINAFPVKEVWMSGDPHTSQTFERVIDAILNSDATYHEPRAGETFVIGSAKIEVVNPKQLTGNVHEGSVSMRVIYGDIKFLFTGDAEAKTEQEMIQRGHNLQSHIFQLGHHASSTSNTKAFLDKVQPEVTIYSSKQGNTYGHPHAEVIQRIQGMNIQLYGTDVFGTIQVITNGKTYEVKTNTTGQTSTITSIATTSSNDEKTTEDTTKQETLKGSQSTSEGKFIASKNSDIYHEIGCKGGANRINASNAIYFDTEQEAQASGRRMCSSASCSLK